MGLFLLYFQSLNEFSLFIYFHLFVLLYCLISNVMHKLIKKYIFLGREPNQQQTI